MFGGLSLIFKKKSTNFQEKNNLQNIKLKNLPIIYDTSTNNL